MAVRAQVEQHIEVHKFSGYAVVSAAFLALILQSSLPKYFPSARYLELPFLITLYFGLSRRNPSTGLLLGTAIGLLQDGLTGTKIGLNGIAKALVGFGASSTGARLDVEHPMSRAILTFFFFHGHQVMYAFTKRILLNDFEAFFTLNTLIASLVNAALAVALFPLLDKLRKAS